MRFTKMQGIGNDYIFINCFEETVNNPESLAIEMSRPHFGVGADGIVLIEPCDSADFGMRIFNADGSEAEICGNATRCIGKFVYERKMTDRTTITLLTKSGIKLLHINPDENGMVKSVRVDMGSPELDPQKIPVNIGGDIVLGHRITAAGHQWPITCVSMGNPHAVTFVPDVDVLELSLIGPQFENNAIFPRRTNTEFVQIIDRKHIKMRVWERGSGETLACGSGACAALVASVLNGKADREVTMQLSGGTLKLEWSASDNHVYQEGPAEYVFEGEYLG
ncbi:MAG: diaminopimelate epimerase [Eubacteriales bacterium]|nr:diaminopimelate epimerase [Eubacteriales bacterium]MDD3882198.1 diaminopimelate epimerase [Eubacteriales bacterium]MDD4512547.1 diaminopimelate epimerase [Eubacteriales bacterium]